MLVVQINVLRFKVHIWTLSPEFLVNNFRVESWKVTSFSWNGFLTIFYNVLFFFTLELNATYSSLQRSTSFCLTRHVWCSNLESWLNQVSRPCLQCGRIQTLTAGDQGYLPFTRENRKFRLENQIACAIPFGMLRKIWALDLKRCNFSTLFSLLSIFGYTLKRVILRPCQIL